MDSFIIKFIFYLALLVQVTLQDSSHENVKSRFNQIIKSQIDRKEYRGLILKNEMKVLLVSDPTTDKSAASMNVKVGSMSNPLELPGLAHFCEHMLYLGTKKYPIQNDFIKYLSENGGSYNAFTKEDYTNYQFDANNENLEGALDRFAQFFLEPLFNETNIEREIRVINSEFEMASKKDLFRLKQLEKFSVAADHPYSRFDGGNTKSLETIPKQKNIDVREELIKFHKKWYSANIMALSVLGKESLDDLEEMVVKMFAKVENKNTEAEKFPNYLFRSNQFQHKWYIVPVEDIRKMIIKFPLLNVEKYYGLAPEYYVTHILQYKGEGSLLAALKKRNWSRSLECTLDKIYSDYNLYRVEFDLTQEGLNHIDEIVTLFYQYINTLKKLGPNERIFNECQNIQNIDFRFQTNYLPSYYVTSIAENLQKYSMEEVLRGHPLHQYDWTDWTVLIDIVLFYLAPNYITIQVAAQVYENITTKLEPWFQIKFRKEKIPEDIIKKWETASFISDFKFPPENEFIPTNFDIKFNGMKIEKFPIIIKETSAMRVWYKKDDEFLLPKAYLTFYFFSPLAYSDSTSINNLYMFVQLILDSLTEYISVPGLQWYIKSTDVGIKFAIEGYDDKQLVLLKKMMDGMRNLKIDEKKFEILKESYIKELKNFYTKDPYQLADYYLQDLLSQKFFTNNDLLDAGAELTVESVRDFIQQFFKKIDVECLIYGNVRRNEAFEIASLVEWTLKSLNDSKQVYFTPLRSKTLYPFQTANLEKGFHYLYEIENALHKNSATIVYYQIGLESTETNMLLELFVQIIAEPTFTILRTNEQLGYAVGSRIMKLNRAQGLQIIVQSEKHPRYIEKRINAFMESMEEYIKNITHKEFNKLIETIVRRISVKPKEMSDMSGAFWNRILTGDNNFNAKNTEVEYLRKITKDQILKFYQEFIQNSSSRKKLSVHVISTAEGGAESSRKIEVAKTSEQEEIILIKDIYAFKASQSFYSPF